MLPTVIGLPYSPCSFGIGYWSILRCWLIVIYLVITTNPHCTIRFWKKKAEDIFSTLNSGKKITKLDLSQAYLQLPIDVQSQQLYFTTINTHKGLFQYTRLPYGIASAPAIFQITMDKILQGLKGVSC